MIADVIQKEVKQMEAMWIKFPLSQGHLWDCKLLQNQGFGDAQG